MIILHAREAGSGVKLCTLKEEQYDYVYAVSTFVYMYHIQMQAGEFTIGSHSYKMCETCFNHPAVQLEMLASVKV